MEPVIVIIVREEEELDAAVNFVLFVREDELSMKQQQAIYDPEVVTLGQRIHTKGMSLQMT
jgi:hypothetical protein